MEPTSLAIPAAVNGMKVLISAMGAMSKHVYVEPIVLYEKTFDDVFTKYIAKLSDG